MVKVIFQNEHIGNGSQGSEKEISIYPMKRQFEVFDRKIHGKVLRRLGGF